ncbi:MAG TPA: SRPBCC family protein [Actinomycetota bacterium]|nr:SRPBCC family protein [Actinomycetota bacterium]
MDADRSAPVFSEGSIDVAASPEVVWDTLADFERWPSWSPGVGSVSLEGPVAEGTTFRWKAGATRLVSVLGLVDRPRGIGWTGRAMGVRAIHVWRFAPIDGGSRVTMEESFDGPVAKLFRSRLRRRLDGTTAAGLRALKDTAEGRDRSDR